jgi:hypothetical protein
VSGEDRVRIRGDSIVCEGLILGGVNSKGLVALAEMVGIEQVTPGTALGWFT